MKVYSYPQIPQFSSGVNGKTGDKQGGAGQNAYERQQKKEEKREEVTEEAVLKAVETYGADEALSEKGITAIPEGTGPGLRVTLRDQTGGVLRSVSGEEFLKLREAIKNGNRSGRILDQKA